VLAKSRVAAVIARCGVASLLDAGHRINDARAGRSLDRMIGPANAQRARITLAAGKESAQSRMREAGPMQKVRFVGLDVHKESIAIAVADGDGSAPQNVATIANDTRVLLKGLKKLVSERRCDAATRRDRQGLSCSGRWLRRESNASSSRRRWYRRRRAIGSRPTAGMR
jgi:hypothetical protein